MNEEIYLGCDPGKNNFYYAIFSTTRGVIETGQVPTITTFDESEVGEQLINFQSFYLSLLSKHQYTHIIAERFQNRGSIGKGSCEEYINAMLGIILSLTYTANQHIHLVMAVTWKNYFKKHFGTNDTHILFEKQWNKHESDAIGMAIYYAIRHGNYSKDSINFLGSPFKNPPM